MDTGAPVLLTLEQVTFSYGAGTVLDGVTLRFRPGETVALLGPNGSGKSTLLGLAAGVLRPDDGTVRLDGMPLLTIPHRERARRIAMVPQTLPVPFAFTVREWVSLGRTPYLSGLGGERQADRAAVQRALEQAEVAALADRRIGEISGGERQRAALAMALAQEPELLLLDEATAHLDLKHQVDLLETVRRLNRDQGLTVIAALHDPNLAALWFHRVLLLHQGRIAADGVPEDVLTPANLEGVFGCAVRVLAHPSAGVPVVVLEKPAAAAE